jgi:RimJ/RimL family protein N-acetyltransferase
MHTNSFLFSSVRLNLRELNLKDAFWFYELNRDPEVMQFTGDKAFNSINETEAFLNIYTKCYARDGMGRWAISLKFNNEIIGWCGLKLHPNGEVDLGFRLFRKHWNKGYASEAAKACIAYGFETIGLKRIIANHQDGNSASKRIIEKLGFKQEYTFLENGKTWLRYSLSD